MRAKDEESIEREACLKSQAVRNRGGRKSGK
jgi:hypothetical protein